MMGHMGNWAHVQWGTGANGVQGYRAHGQWHGAMRFRGYGYRDWGTWAMGAQGVMCYREYGYRGMGHMLPMCSIVHVPHCPCAPSLLSPSRSMHY